MAITKIHAIKSTVQKSIEYICNPHKTDNRILVDSFACGIETAELDSQMENASGRPDANPAYHVIQSFAPGEVTFEEAHAIGKELAERLLHSTHPYVLTTHVDKEHVHNHLIFCSADMISHTRYNDCMRSYRHLRSLSDTLCKEHHLSVITLDGKKGMNYKEWEADKKNISVKQILRWDIFECKPFSTLATLGSLLIHVIVSFVLILGIRVGVRRNSLPTTIVAEVSLRLIESGFLMRSFLIIAAHSALVATPKGSSLFPPFPEISSWLTAHFIAFIAQLCTLSASLNSSIAFSY